MKLLFITFLTFLQSSLFSQTLFLGDQKELDQQIKLTSIPDMKVWNKDGEEFQLNVYLNNRQTEVAKPYLIVLWASGVSGTKSRLNDLHQSSLADDCIIVTLNITTKDNSEDIAKQFKSDLADGDKLDNNWKNFILLSTTFNEVASALYQDVYPVIFYADKQMNIITKTQFIDLIQVKRIVSEIASGKIVKNKTWVTKTGDQVGEKDASAFYFQEYLQQDDRIQVKSGTKTKLMSNMNYRKLGNDYLFDGIIEVQNDEGQKIASGKFREGKPIVTFSVWHDNGKLKSIYPVNGINTVYNETGKVVMTGQISNGLGNGKFIQYDNDGKMMAEHTYKNGVLSGLQKEYSDGVLKEWFLSNDFEQWGNLQEGLQVVRKNSLYGFSDRNGKIIIPIKYVRASGFENGKAAVYLNSRYFSINIKGEETK